MRIDAGRFSFVAPAGFGDITGYYFIEPGGPNRIEIGGGFLPYQVSDLDGVVGDRRSGMPVPPDSQSMSTLDGHPARTLVYTLFQGLRVRIAMALDPVTMGNPEGVPQTPPAATEEKPRYVQIAFMAPAADQGEAARFDHVVESTTFAGEDATEPRESPDGWVRRYAGRLWLDVPEGLPPPRTYIFRSPDETMRIEVALVDPSDEPGIEREIADDISLGGTVKDRTETEIAAGHLSPRGPLSGPLAGTLHAYTITRVEDGAVREDVVRRAHLFLRDVPVAHVYGRAPSIDAPPLDATLDALVRGVEETGRR